MNVPTKVYISSESPVKHRAVKRAFARVGLDVETVGFKVSSGVNEQPLTLQETYEGARNRHAHLQKVAPLKSGYFVTSESGVVKPFPDAPWKGCEAIIITQQPENNSMIGFDLGAEYPEEMMSKVPEVYPDLGVLVQKEYDLAEKDPPLYLTKGRISRSDLLEQAVFKVLAQMVVAS